MLRNTVYGNELALPATNAYQRSIMYVVGMMDWLGYETSRLLVTGAVT